MARAQYTQAGLIVIIAIGGLACALGGWLAWRQSRIATWPKATARIISFDEGIDPNYDGHWYANPKVQFEFVLNGQRYLCDALNPSPLNYQSEAEFRKDTLGFRVGARVPCWYNRSRPEEAYLVSRGVTTGPVALVVFGGGCLAAAVLLKYKGQKVRQIPDDEV